ncbi:hypothetical protein F2Q70_00022506 [Brassica cretica]|uniref:Replication factor A C-terminal domain-containing protein n=1 Tax=Brassica cretica TaxID=69181 RepID=A0A8S9GFI9_BRACR|nr:hypothetical protein F2Q70_00022506 [Brassica cretica]
MKSSSNTSVSGDLISEKRNGKGSVSSAEPINRTDQPRDSSAKAVSVVSMSKKSNGKAVLCSDVPMRHTGGNSVSSAKTHEVMFFKDVRFGPQEGELRFRLIHFWEARNPIKKVLIGIEMLLIDEQGTVIQGFIPPGRIDTYLPHMIAGSIYRLTNFYGSRSKTVSVHFLEDRFRFNGYEEFEAGCDLRGDLYGKLSTVLLFVTDYVGHIKLMGEQALTAGLVLDEVEIASSRRLMVHVQTHDGPVMKLYLWDKAATDFCEKFKAHVNTPSVILVTTVNPKRFGGALTLSSLSSSRVFLDLDVQPTRDYLTWLDSNTDVANRVNPDIVNKAETVTIGDLFSYIKHEGSKVAWFECTATIDDVVHGSAWYYISCGGCKTKATKGHTTLMCKKCGKAEVTGVAKYLTKLSVYDKNDHGFFVILGDAGRELTGKLASELVERYFEANESVGDDHMVPVPQALIDTIGQTRTFIVKVSKHNLDGKTQSLTVTKVLPLEAAAADGNLEENVIVSAVEETLQMGKRVDGSSSEHEGSTDAAVKRSFDGDESEEAKRAKCG